MADPFSEQGLQRLKQGRNSFTADDFQENYTSLVNKAFKEYTSYGLETDQEDIGGGVGPSWKIVNDRAYIKLEGIRTSREEKLKSKLKNNIPGVKSTAMGSWWTEIEIPTEKFTSIISNYAETASTSNNNTNSMENSTKMGIGVLAVPIAAYAVYKVIS